MTKEKTISVRGRLIVSLAALFAINIAVIFLVQLQPDADAATYRQGSRGEVVRKIQTNLKKWGYYGGAVDGVYGAKTAEAVKYFQKKNGLTADGIAGPKTLAALGINDSSSSSVSQGNQNNDLYLLARIISAEARGEPYEGQVAVGAVVMNRVKHASFPNTISGVIYQNGAFTAISDGQFNEAIADSAHKAAQAAMNGVDPTGGCIYYYNPATATSQWIRSRPIKLVIGNHTFCT